jgi:hypothetical protein
MTFIPADIDGFGAVQPTVEKPMSLPLTYAEDLGAPLIDDGFGNWLVCGPNPPLIGAIALTPGGIDATSLAGVGGFNIRGRKEFPNNTMQATLVQGNKRFRAKYVGTLPATPGGSFGIIRDVDGTWKVNFADNVNTRVKYLGGETALPEGQPVIFVTFLAANIQQN